MNTIESLLKSHTVTIKTILNLFKAYVQIIFLYKSDLWTTTKTIEDRTDSFQRILLCRVMGVRWPKIINNKELYEKAGAEKWSNLVNGRRLLWLGHLLRLDEKTPAKKALAEYLNINDETKLQQHLNVLSGNRKLWKTLA